jgi:DNA-binding transcriptional LysR family regulator
LTLRELPLAVPPVQVDVLWHRRNQQSSAHRWLLQATQTASEREFAAEPGSETGSP